MNQFTPEYVLMRLICAPHVTIRIPFVDHANNQNKLIMRTWLHLAKVGLAEKVSGKKEARMFAGLFAFFKTLLPDISNELEQEIRKRCVVVRFKKGAQLLDFKQVCGHCFFAVKGLVKAVREPGKVERINWFMGGGDVIISVQSFFTQTPSNEQLVVMKTTECIALHNDDLQWIYKNYIEFNIIGRLLAEKYYGTCDERASWNGLSVADKLEALLKEYPNILQEVPKVAVAAFLGVHVATISRSVNSRSKVKKS